MRSWWGHGPRVPRRAGQRARQPTPSSWPALLTQSQRRLDELGIVVPAPFDLDAFVAQVEQRVRGGRRLQLVGFRATPDTTTECGYLLLRSGRPDLVSYQQGITPRDRLHNAVHELAHLIWGHRGVRVPASAVGEAVIMSGQRQEDEADALAAVVLGRWDERPHGGYAARQALALTAARAHEAFG